MFISPWIRISLHVFVATLKRLYNLYQTKNSKSAHDARRGGSYHLSIISIIEQITMILLQIKQSSYMWFDSEM